MTRSKLMVFRTAAAMLFLIAIGAGIGLTSPSKAQAATSETLALLSSGKQFLGTPYLFGATSGITSAFDCSSFIQYVFRKNGTELPRTASAQSTIGKKVAQGSLNIGDLVFFRSTGTTIGHVAMYAGNGMILHASSSKGVTVTSLNTSYWQERYVTAKRII